MDIWEVMRSRHAVRSFQDIPISDEHVQMLNHMIDSCNREGHLHMQLVLNEPEALRGAVTFRDKFKNAKNYIAMIGRRGDYLDDRLGYYGEKIVLLAQQMGLRTCWVAYSFKKIEGVYDIDDRELLRAIILIGYGENDGKPHKVKGITEVCMGSGPMPDWFRDGMMAAVLAPSYRNHQKYMLTLDGDSIEARPGMGIGVKLDLGIARCHFEIGAAGYPYKWTIIY